ncbi:lysophospholipid acyltransferase family protein [Trueperella sp. LYQ143]|uniref:lysophospholipid acyltransferase family protein n=1 Tax=Trueperella sp. LYQ143 TaxID=3391059 RepID=UPI0039836A3A
MSSLHPLDDYHSESRRDARKNVRRFLTRPVIKTLLNTTVSGQENVEGLTGAYIVVGNHSSHLDAPMVFTLLPEHMTERLATGAAADYFYRKPTISKLTSLFFNTYPIERKSRSDDPRSGMAKGMTGRLLREGIPILIFPEGTRSRTGELGEFKPGAAALAIKYNVPIVPLAMSGGHEAMPVGAKLPTLNHPPVNLYISRPMYPQSYEDAVAFMGRVRSRIAAMLEQQTANPVEAGMVADKADADRVGSGPMAAGEPMGTGELADMRADAGVSEPSARDAARAGDSSEATALSDGSAVADPGIGSAESAPDRASDKD